VQSIAGKNEDTSDDMHYATSGKHYLPDDEESDTLPDAGSGKSKRTDDFLIKTW